MKQASKPFCVIHVANKSNNNREINAANKTGLRKCSYSYTQ